MSVLAISELSESEQRTILQECGELADLAAALKRSRTEYERNQLEHDAKVAQALEDISAGRPVRWCEHCQATAAQCWFHRKHK